SHGIPSSAEGKVGRAVPDLETAPRARDRAQGGADDVGSGPEARRRRHERSDRQRRHPYERIPGVVRRPACGERPVGGREGNVALALTIPPVASPSGTEAPRAQLFPALTAEQIARITSHGRVRSVQAGEVRLAAGERKPRALAVTAARR